MIASYPDLRQQIMNKPRGRKHEVLISSGPDLWAYMPLGFDRDVQVYLDSSRATVCTIRPNNSLEIDIYGWRTQLSCRIIEELTGRSAGLNKNRIWHCGIPIDGLICYDSDRYYVEPRKFVVISNKAHALLDQVTFADLPPRERLLKEMGQWGPTPAVTAKVKAYARGEIAKDQLGARDILTCCMCRDAIIYKLFEEAA